MKLKRTLSLVLILSLVMTLATPIGTPVYAVSDPGNYIFDISEGRITVLTGTESDTLKVSYGAAQVLDNIPEAQEITIRGSIEENSENRIVVNIPGQTAAINIDNINIELTTGNLCAFFFYRRRYGQSETFRNEHIEKHRRKCRTSGY